MERRVARAQGARTEEEKNDLNKEKEEVDKALIKNQNDHKDLTDSLKRLEDELRSIDRKLGSIELERKKYKNLISTL
jgi:septal ring factor EnvC (AmiA/AmiB activator)